MSGPAWTVIFPHTWDDRHVPSAQPMNKNFKNNLKVLGIQLSGRALA
jgi:hypothetical protein